MVEQPFFGTWPRFQSVGLLGRGTSSSHALNLHIEQHKHRIYAHRHPYLDWDSNPRSERSSERRQFMPWTAPPRDHCGRRTNVMETLSKASSFKHRSLKLCLLDCLKQHRDGWANDLLPEKCKIAAGSISSIHGKTEC
jgi:hypothetical protein